MVEGIDEVRAELQTEPFGYQEIFVHTSIDIDVTRRSEACELWRTVSERTNCGLSEVVVVCKPLGAYPWDWSIFD